MLFSTVLATVCKSAFNTLTFFLCCDRRFFLFLMGFKISPVSMSTISDFVLIFSPVCCFNRLIDALVGFLTRPTTSTTYPCLPLYLHAEDSFGIRAYIVL